MARTKIDYGIDLGTTNSSIARNDAGKIRIIKSDDPTQSDTTPSCVFYDRKKRTIVGQSAHDSRVKESEDSFARYMKGKETLEENSFIEFKRNMGTDKPNTSSNMRRSFSSEELSAEVLKKLKSYVRDDDEISAIVITVPAMFKQPQIDATQRAADLAGFQYCELLQEPIAASIAYGLSAKRTDGYWLVFDFGGGTFDAALMKVVEGIIKVVGTSGDNHLGGKNIDDAIVDNILIPHVSEKFSIANALSDDRGRRLLQEALKSVAEEIKIALAAKESFAAYTADKVNLGEDESGEEIIVDLTITLSEFEAVVSPLIQRAIDITKKLLESKNIAGKDLETVILVGGPTNLQTLRRMLKEQITPNFDVSIDPMTAVAHGAALFASTRDIPGDIQIRDKAKIQLKLKYPETTVETVEKLGIKVERTLTVGEVPQKVFVEVARNDTTWSSGRIELEGDAEIIEIHLQSGQTNGFRVTLFDEKGNIFPCEPSSFTIIQGMKIASATLSYHLCVEAIDTRMGKQCIVPIDGLKKDNTLPCKGKGTFKTQKDIRPGNKEDQIHIRLFNAKEPESRAFADERAGTFIITGDQLPQFLPKDSDVELTIEVDASRRITCAAYFPHIDETVEHIFEQITTKGLEADELERDIDKAKHTLSMLLAGVENIDASRTDKLEQQLEEVSDMLQQGRADYARKMEVLDRLREVWKEIDKLQEASEWPTAEQELCESLNRISTTQERYGNEETAKIIVQFKQYAQKIIKDRDNIKLARELIDQVYSLEYEMLKENIGLWVSWLKGYDDNFDVHEWKNKNAARRLIDEGKQVLMTNPSKAKIESIVRQLFGLLPEKEKPIIGGGDDKLLKK